MIKRAMIIVLGVFAAVIIAATSFFYLVSDPVQPVERPSSVPAEAVWAGGADGGSWIGCTLAEAKGTYRCSIYSEKGTLLKEGFFALSGEAAAYVEDPKNSINAYDGKHILLSGRMKLAPVDSSNGTIP
jgi:hypothetical protein